MKNQSTSWKSAFSNMNKTTKSNMITYAMVILIFVGAKIWLATGTMSYHLQGLLLPLCAYIMLAISLNLTVGILGELSLGHAGFMCVGAFTGALFTKITAESISQTWLRMLLALIIGAAAAAVFGILIGIPILRLRGDYLAIVTLAFGEIIKNLLNVLYIGTDSKGLHISMKDAMSLGLEADGTKLVSGPLGISGISRDSTFELGLILILLTLVIVLNLVNSRAGRAIMAVRDNRIAAESIGINVAKYKLIAFSISAALAGMAGVFYAHSYPTMAAAKYDYNFSILILVLVVLGGIGNIRGSVISAIVLTLLPELLRSLNDYRMLIYAIVLIVMMIFNWAPKCLQWREVTRAKMKARFKKEAA